MSDYHCDRCGDPIPNDAPCYELTRLSGGPDSHSSDSVALYCADCGKEVQR